MLSAAQTNPAWRFHSREPSAVRISRRCLAQKVFDSAIADGLIICLFPKDHPMDCLMTCSLWCLTTNRMLSMLTLMSKCHDLCFGQYFLLFYYNVSFRHVDCNDSHSYCGLRDQFYPDRRAMGFPFDRMVPKEINHMEDFARSFSNMKRTVVEIRFTNTTISKVWISVRWFYVNLMACILD